MSLINWDKTVDTAAIDCNGSFEITLSLTAAPDILTNPTDIVLILDRSGSMAGQALENMKKGAKKFVEIIEKASDGAQDGQIGSGSHIGIVSFAGTATQDTPLITSAEQLNLLIDSLTAGGSTNHRDAFVKAKALFAPASANAKVMVMFTDGATTTGGDANEITDLAKSEGIDIYCIGLFAQGADLTPTLEAWASSPASDHVLIAPDEAKLEAVFADLAEDIAKPGVTGVLLTDVIDPCFQITAVSMPSKGTASLLGTDTVQWRMDELGAVQSERAELRFTVQHTGTCSGNTAVNRDIFYTDNEGNTPVFPSPVISVNCGVDVFPEPCPQPLELLADPCSDALALDAGDLQLDSLGRILELSLTLKSICPNRRVALAAILTEVAADGTEHKRGIKTMTIPAFTDTGCRDLTIRCIKFVLPEDLALSGSPVTLCNPRSFRVRLLANYIDSDYTCCGQLS